jgi:hypothetical protein
MLALVVAQRNKMHVAVSSPQQGWATRKDMTPNRRDGCFLNVHELVAILQ